LEVIFSQGILRFNSPFNSPAKTANIEVQEPNRNSFRRRFSVREFNPRIETHAARGVVLNLAINGTVTSQTVRRSFRRIPRSIWRAPTRHPG
jgi:hypothetical protein